MYSPGYPGTFFYSGSTRERSMLWGYPGMCSYAQGGTQVPFFTLGVPENVLCSGGTRVCAHMLMGVPGYRFLYPGTFFSLGVPGILYTQGVLGYFYTLGEPGIYPGVTESIRFCTRISLSTRYSAIHDLGESLI